MKINDFPYELLRILEAPLKERKHINFQPIRDVNINAHVRLEQDRRRSYYLEIVAKNLFINTRTCSPGEHFINWQIRETYRVVNAIFASAKVEGELLGLIKLKQHLEETSYLKSILKLIDEGKFLPDLVFTGHGVHYEEDGLFELESDVEVALYSGPGGKLSDSLAVDIENNCFDQNKTIVINKKNGTLETGIDTRPRFFSSRNISKIPNLSMVQCENEYPRPRVLEPFTGRVYMDVPKSAKNGRNYLFLSEVTKQFKGTKRRISFAGCTGIRDAQGNRVGEFLDLCWSKIEEYPNKQLKTSQEDESILMPPNP